MVVDRPSEPGVHNEERKVEGLWFLEEYHTENGISGANAGLECLLISLPLDYQVGLISIF